MKLVSGFHGPNDLHQQRWLSTELGFKPRINLKLGPDRILPAISPVTVNLDGVVQLRWVGGSEGGNGEEDRIDTGQGSMLKEEGK